MHCPKHLQRSVQGNSALKHLHLPEHDFLQLHFISSLHALAASGISVHRGTNMSCSFFHPHKVGSPII